MIVFEIITIASLWISVCTGSLETTDRKSNIQYSVKDIAGDVRSPYMPVQQVIRRDSPWNAAVESGPDAPLDRVKRLDGGARWKRSPSDPVIQRVKRQELGLAGEGKMLDLVKHEVPGVVGVPEKNGKGPVRPAQVSGTVDHSQPRSESMEFNYIESSAKSDNMNKRDLPSIDNSQERSKREVVNVDKHLQGKQSLGNPAAKKDTKAVKHPLETPNKIAQKQPWISHPVDHETKINQDKRYSPSIDKSQDRSKREVSNAVKPTQSKLLEDPLNPAVKKDVKTVNHPLETPKKIVQNQPWIIHPGDHETQVNKDTIAAIAKDFKPMELNFKDHNVKNLAENLENIRRRKREIRKAQVALDRQAETERENRMKKRRELRHLREKMEQEGDWSAVIRG